MSVGDDPGIGMGAATGGVLDTLDLNGVHLALVSPEGKVIWASPSLLASRGGDLIGSPCHPNLFRRESDCVPCHREEVLATGRPYRCWIPERRPGRFGPRQMLVQMRSPDGNLLEAVIEAGPADRLFYDQIFRERVLSEGLRHVPSGVLMLDAVMRVVTANPAAEKLLSIREDELRGHPLHELLPPGTLPATGADLARLLAERAGLEKGELEIGEPDQRCLVHLSLAAVTDPDDQLAAAVAIFTDLTQERLVGEALTRKLGELTLLQQIGDVLSRVSRLDQVLRVMLSAVVHPEGLGLSQASLFLVDEQEGVIRGRMARTRGVGPALPDFGSLAAELESMGAGDQEEWMRGAGKEVRNFWVPLSCQQHPLVAALTMHAPMRLELDGDQDQVEPKIGTMLGRAPALLAPLSTQGKQLGVLVGVRDETDPRIDDDRLALAGLIAGRAAGAIERARLHDELADRLAELRESNARQRHLQRQLLRAEKLSAIGELAAEIVHQIRNPLAIVGGFARRIARTMSDDDPRTADLKILLEESDRIEAILERIRQDVRLAHSSVQGSVDLKDVVGAALARYRDLAREQQVTLDTSVEEGLPAVRGSRDILLEVLDNLVRNAFDAVESEGHVKVSARRLKDAVHLVVEDDGPGLSEDQLEKVFEPFYTTKVRGTGLGLPLAKRLIAQCGASLSVDSRLHEGARFRIMLPVAQDEFRGVRDA